MGRIFLTESSRQHYFSTLKKVSNLSWIALAEMLDISPRQFRDIKRGRYSLSSILAENIKREFNIDLPSDKVIKKDYWYSLKAAKIGGNRRIALYGSPATSEGRKKGGFKSIIVHQKNNSAFVIKKQIKIPHNNSNLAEIIGAIIGDGSITHWQTRISLNINTDKDYSVYIFDLLTKVFEINPYKFERIKNSTIEVVVSSVLLSKFLHKQGLPIGNKIKQNLDIPQWIYSRKSWRIACLRGIFDTDGCTYIDKHVYLGKIYYHVGVVFITKSEALLNTIVQILQNLGYTPTTTSKHRIYLRKEREVIRFFREINPANKRHENIFKNFWEEYRSGYNGTVSKAVVRH